jgi:hypothetical protein
MHKSHITKARISMQSALFFEFSRTMYSEFLHNSLHNATDISKVKLTVLHLSIVFFFFVFLDLCIDF